MVLVALTGNIASGKSEVGRLLGQHGATIIDADVLARRAVERGRPAYRAIVERWGREILLPDESIDRAALRHIIFANPRDREALNAIVHPRIEELRDASVLEARRRGDRVVVCDIPLLFERGLEAKFDRIILVDAPAATRLERLRRTRRLDEVEAKAMMASQMPADLKRRRADYIIDNDGSLESLAQRVEEIWNEIEKGSLDSGH
jgi:dephospho-CoA kinase